MSTGKRVINTRRTASISGNFEFIAKIKGVDRLAWGIGWDGDLLGDLTIEISNDGVNWFPSSAVVFPPSGGPGKGYAELETAAAYARLLFVYVGGFGTLTSHLIGKAHG